MNRMGRNFSCLRVRPCRPPEWRLRQGILLGTSGLQEVLSSIPTTLLGISLGLPLHSPDVYIAPQPWEHTTHHDFQRVHVLSELNLLLHEAIKLMFGECKLNLQRWLHLLLHVCQSYPELMGASRMVMPKTEWWCLHNVDLWASQIHFLTSSRVPPFLLWAANQPHLWWITLLVLAEPSQSGLIGLLQLFLPGHCLMDTLR